MNIEQSYYLECNLRKELIRLNPNDGTLKIIFCSTYDAVKAYSKAITNYW